MSTNGIHIHELPKLKNPILIAGFSGWGNALQMSIGMASFIGHKLNARKIAEIDPDVFFRYDEMRPRVHIEDGIFKSLKLPKGAFFAVQTGVEERDLVILKSDEPNLRWGGFVKELFSLCHLLKVETVITMGSLFDNVLHTDRIISAIVSDNDMASLFNQKGINLISYQGPSAIHSIIHEQGLKKGLQCMSLWCHCPFYMQGFTHSGLLAYLGKQLADVGGFILDTGDLDKSWEQQNKNIENLIINNQEIKNLTDDLLKVKKRGLVNQIKDTIKLDEKVINIQDFLNPK